MTKRETKTNDTLDFGIAAGAALAAAPLFVAGDYIAWLGVLVIAWVAASIVVGIAQGIWAGITGAR